MHETIYMTGPYEGPPVQSGSSCGYATLPNDPTSGGLQSLVQAENQYFLPVLGEYHTAYGSNLTQLNVAVGMQPKLTTVWLGANDLLKFIFSAGTAPASDTPTQMAADLTKIVKSLTATGSKVLIADLPTLLPTTGNPVPQFFPQAKLSADLQSLGIPAAYANAAVAYIGTKYGVTAGGYLTETGFLDVVELCAGGSPLCVTPPLDPSGPGTGLGSVYLTPAFAAEVQALNAGYNQAIDGVAQQFAAAAPGQVALVPITTFFQTASTSGLSIAGLPGPLTLQFGGGLVSWDGLHPANAGYAAIANEFIATADASAASGGLGLTIPAAQRGATHRDCGNRSVRSVCTESGKSDVTVSATNLRLSNASFRGPTNRIRVGPLFFRLEVCTDNDEAFCAAPRFLCDDLSHCLQFAKRRQRAIAQ